MKFLTPSAPDDLRLEASLNAIKREHAIWAGGKDRGNLGTGARTGIPSLVLMSRKAGIGVLRR
jgi:hypothetical protein